MFETLAGTKSLFRVFLKHFLQKIKPSLLDLEISLLFFKVKVHLHILFHYFFGTFAREQVSFGQQNMKYYSSRKNITFWS